VGADALQRQQTWGQIDDERLDERVKLGDLVVELKQPGRKRLAGDLRRGRRSRKA
jgi:hypothetical protein